MQIHHQTLTSLLSLQESEEKRTATAAAAAALVLCAPAEYDGSLRARSLHHSAQAVAAAAAVDFAVLSTSIGDQ